MLEKIQAQKELSRKNKTKWFSPYYECVGQPLETAIMRVALGIASKKKNTRRRTALGPAEPILDLNK